MRLLFSVYLLVFGSYCFAVDNHGFQLRAEPSYCTRADPIDVNLGNSAESFVRTAFCQVTGREPTQSVVSDWSNRLRSTGYTRRTDVVRTFCNENGRANCKLSYSNPWTNMNTQVRDGCIPKQRRRELGAVMMFFFNCPQPTNCDDDWANTHQLGFRQQDPWYENNYLNPNNVGYWYRELQDARWAGMTFMALNVYGFDIEDGSQLRHVNTALDRLNNGLKIAAFFDSWTWGQPWFSPAWQQIPNLSDPDKASDLIYNMQVKPFFSVLSRKYWYTFKNTNRPIMWMYNAGTLKPAGLMGGVLRKLKERFRNDFGVEPFIVLDIAFDGWGSQDGRFQWDTFPVGQKMASFTENSVTIANSMIKWDSLNRDQPNAISSSNVGDTDHRRMFKGPELLNQYLANTADSTDIALLATWNDLGEGTGIARQYDYFYKGEWLPPDYFMAITRDAQCETGGASGTTSTPIGTSTTSTGSTGGATVGQNGPYVSVDPSWVWWQELPTCNSQNNHNTGVNEEYVYAHNFPTQLSIKGSFNVQVGYHNPNGPRIIHADVCKKDFTCFKLGASYAPAGDGKVTLSVGSGDAPIQADMDDFFWSVYSIHPQDDVTNDRTKYRKTWAIYRTTIGVNLIERNC